MDLESCLNLPGLPLVFDFKYEVPDTSFFGINSLQI
jgi:hypothetical protein